MVWAALAAVATIAVFPYLMQLAPDSVAALPVPLPALIAIQALQMFILIALLAWTGLRMGHRVGLGSPLLQRWVNGHGVIDLGTLRPGHSVALGIGAAVLILLLSHLLDPLLLPAPKVQMQEIDGAHNALYGLLASFYGGIVEELQLRLFLMTLLVWAAALVARLRLPRATRGTTPWARPSPTLLWGAIVTAAVLFGIGHLPAAASVWELDTAVILRTVALNAIGGIAFGWVFWKRGLEMAVLAHFSADLVLHVLVPLLLPQTVL